MSGRDALLARLSVVERRLADHAARPLPAGLTEPDPGAEERWEAGQVWAHLAEFPAYWLGQLRGILDARAGGADEPPPFGRSKTDPGRVGAIERDRHTHPAALLERVRTELTEVADAIRGLPDDAWVITGLHPSLGEVSVGRVIERFIVSHLEEHAAQLDGLEHH